MPPAVGKAAAISASTRDTQKDKPPTIVQLAKADSGPPVYMTQPKRTGMPDMKFMEVKVAAQFSNKPRWRKNSTIESQKTCSARVMFFRHEA